MPINPNDPINGFEGLIIENQLEREPQFPIGFEGILSVEKTPQANDPLGFRGILYTYSETERFIKITDFRKRPINGVKVTAQNSGGAVAAITGLDGIAALEIDQSGSISILIEKDKTFKSISYTYASESLVKEVILQPRLL